MINLQGTQSIRAEVSNQAFLDYSEKGSNSATTLLLSRLNLYAPGPKKGQSFGGQKYRPGHGSSTYLLSQSYFCKIPDRRFDHGF